MIDLENDVFTAVHDALREKYGDDIDISSEYVDAPAKFPAVTLTESDNRVLANMRTLNVENAASVMYELHVFSNKTNGKKAQAKEIASVVDDVLSNINFTRTFRSQVPNLKNASIFQLVCRYEAVIDKDFWIYQT